MLAIDASPNALSPQFTYHSTTLLKVKSMDGTMSPILNESSSQSRFPHVSPIPGSSTTCQTANHDSPTTDYVRGFLSTAHSFSVAPVFASPPSTMDQTALLSQQCFPSSGNLGPCSVEPSPNASVSISASPTYSPTSTLATILSCSISGCLRTFTQARVQVHSLFFISLHIKSRNCALII